MDDVVLPVQVDIGDVRLLSKGSLDGTGAVQAMNAELERAASHRNMVGVSCCRGPGSLFAMVATSSLVLLYQCSSRSRGQLRSEGPPAI